MDVREILKALSPEDRILWSQARTEMRRIYLNTHNMTVGIAAWDASDDAMVDLLDIKLATLFDRSGRINAVTDVVGAEDTVVIEKAIEADDDQLKVEKLVKYEGSPASKMLADNNGWK